MRAFGRLAKVRLSQFMKARGPMYVTEFGSLADVSPVPENARAPMTVTESLKVTDVKDEHLSNSCARMDVIVSGITA